MCPVVRDEGIVRGVNTVVGILRELVSNRVEMKNQLEQCGVRATEELVDEVLSRVKFDMGIDEFHSLLSALCRYKNVEDAEHLMFVIKMFFYLYEEL
ncbi:pentatricopeptide repeat-containing protein [Tripterygium wilfordii]|uniref:Pentatricopeptide repeat-containing protein n=1 Tax=Tripterygium wilfordii TaxID=458696 RepID=A0A7J7CMM1_TRIWF|nr:pentatricopeptide repeat-containing protein [Tripterygium wilfordii]